MIEIVKWSETFENADTRKRQRLGWHLTPSGCESRGYRQLMRKGAQGVIAFGVFRAICQLYATFVPVVRQSGAMTHSGGSEMDLDDLAELTRIDRKLIADSLPILQEVGWISTENGQSATSVPPSCQSHPGFVKGEGEGEGEGKGEEPPNPLRGDSDELLDKFWKAYPQKGRERARSRANVKKAWDKVKASERPSEAILMRSLADWKKSEHWAEGYVCGAHLFVRDRMWEDAPKPARAIGAGFATKRPPTPPADSDDFSDGKEAVEFLKSLEA